MRNKIQKYLSGEREGFSLVELIIVIAIMAILIGVVALAVIPYLNKSRESKDITALDNVLSALTSSVGTTKAQGSGTITITDGGDINGATASTGGDASKVKDAMEEVLGNATIDMESKNGDGCTINCSYDTTTNQMAVYLTGGSSTDTTSVTIAGTATTVPVTSDDEPYCVTNGADN